MKHRAIALVFLLCHPLLGDRCEEDLGRLNEKPIQLVVGADNRLHFQVKKGKTLANRVLGTTLTAAAAPFWLRSMSRVIEKMASDKNPVPVYDKMLAALDIRYQPHGLSADAIPRQGPLVVVANHPRFGVEGLAIGSLISKVRSDLKVAMNEMMQTVPGFKEIAFGVEMGADRNSNLKAYREMRDWLKQGHAVLIFPAGAVSGYQATSGQIGDKAWTRSVPLLAQQSQAPVLPIYVSAYRPGLTFRILDRLASPAQKSTYPVEILRQRGSTLDLTLGSLLDSGSLSGFSTSQDAARFIQQIVYGLGTDTQR